MARIPYSITLSVSLASNATGDLQYNPSANQNYEIHSLVVESTGAFDLVSVIDGDNNFLSNASLSNPLNGANLPSNDDDFHSSIMFVEPYLIDGNGEIKFTVKDTSAASNTVKFVLSGILITQQ